MHVKEIRSPSASSPPRLPLRALSLDKELGKLLEKTRPWTALGPRFL